MKVSAPKTPDLAESTRAGYEADLSTLPLRLMVEQAASQGKSYTDPQTGKTYDFSQYGGEEQRIARDIAANMQLMQGGADISRTLELQRLQDELALMPQYNALNLQSQRDAYNASLDAGEEATRRAYEQELQYLPKFNQAQIASQADTYRASLDLGDEGARRNAALQAELLPEINALSLAEQQKAYDASLAAGRAGDPKAAALRDAMIEMATNDLAAGDQLTDGQRMRAEQNVRRGQASRGNILGPTASLEEAMAITGYGDQLKQQRQAAAVSALGTQPLSANFTTQTAVNTMAPQLQSQQQLNNLTPNFQATTTSGPNLGAANVQRSNLWTYGNQQAGQQGQQWSMDVWKTKNSNAQKDASALNNVLGSAAGMASMFM